MMKLRLKDTATLIQRVKYHLAPYFYPIVGFSVVIAAIVIGYLLK